ncbi:MAG: sigma-70 family RNA polymerase sigma factor [Planctomycetota bacterium]
MTNPHSHFASTQWTLVWRAATEETADARPALEELIQRYWSPLYSFARRQGWNREDAEDATQEFLSGVVHGDMLQAADPAKGKFRTYLLVAWKRFLIDQYRRRRSQRRGGDVQLLSIDFQTSERKWLEVQSHDSDADRVYELCWAKSLLDEVRNRLQDVYSRRGRTQLFAVLLPRLTEALTAADYQKLADDLSISPSAVKVALHRLRQRFGQSLREVVLETLDDPSEIDAELAELRSVLAGESPRFSGWGEGRGATSAGR